MTTILISLACAAIAGIGAWLITRAFFLSRLQAQEHIYIKERENAEKLAAQAQENYERALKEMKETVTASVAAETQKLLKERQTELAKGNQSDMEGILKPLKESIEAMQKVADGQATKVIIPSEMQGLVGLANGIVEGTKK